MTYIYNTLECFLLQISAKPKVHTSQGKRGGISTGFKTVERF